MKKIRFTKNNVEEYAPDKSGIYYFFDKIDKLLYIGQSVNLKKRLKQHLTHSHLSDITEFYYFTFSLCDAEILDKIEALMITDLKPSRNSIRNRYTGPKHSTTLRLPESIVEYLKNQSSKEKVSVATKIALLIEKELASVKGD